MDFDVFGVGLADLLARWPLVRQLTEGDPLGLGKAAQSERSAALKPRIADAERVVPSICPYCAVGCGQLVYVKDGEVTQIEGDPASPISRGRLCPKGAASKNYVTGPRREYEVKYRRPGEVCLRWSVFRAGLQSARDPRYTVEPQRRRLEETRR